MKKAFLLFLSFCLFLAISSFGQDSFYDYIISSKKIESPSLQKVFPGVDFQVETSQITMPTSKRIIAKFEKNDYLLPQEFNLIFDKVKNKSDASDFEIIEAFVQIVYWFRNNEEQKTIIVNPVSTKYEERTFNFEVKLEINGNRYRLLILFDGNQIKRTEIFVNENKESVISPKLVTTPSKQATLSIGVSGISPQNFGGINHYYIAVSNNGTATNNSVTFQVSSLSPNQANVRLQVKPIYGFGGSFFLNQLLTVNNSGTASYTWTPPNNNNTGICEIQVDEGGGVITSMQNTWIIPEKIMTGTFTVGYAYTLYYTDQFFSNHTQGINHALTFATNVKDALVSSWNKEVAEWDLCQGITNSQPIDNDMNYQVFINDSKDQPTNNKYHSNEGWTDAFGGSDRIIEIGTRISQFINNYSPEKDLIFPAICHEFYHGIQWSHNSSWGSGDWMIEGQARFLQTVFMDAFSTPNEEFLIGRMYQGDANDYLQNQTNTSLNSLAYNYCFFWRFLYENYSAGNAQQKLAIIRETCRGNTNSSISGIETFMDLKLNGTFTTFDAAIKDFAKRSYLNNTQYNLWNPCPSDAFYVNPPITGDGNSDGITETYKGDLISKSDNISSSFGIDYMAFNFDADIEDVNIDFNGDPDSDNNKADFYVNVLLFDGNTLISENVITLTNGKGKLEFDVNDPVDKAVVVITRLDSGEGATEDDYIVNLGQGIDVALVIDRSGSMAGSYLTSAKTAAKSFVDLMQLNDYLAVVSFDNYSYVNFPFTQLTSDQVKTNAKNAINNITAGNTTSIGKGMQAAQGQLNLGNTSKSQGMVLLSDGYENTSPYVSTVLPTIPGNTDIYTIALGPNSDQNLLNNIAANTGGFYSYSPNTQRLSLIYNSIRAKVTGQQTLAMILGLIAQGQNILQQVWIDAGVTFANFSLTWPGSNLDLVLTDPLGAVIDHNVNNPNISFTSGDTYETYTILNPIPGQYTMQITGVTVTGQEDYTALVSVESSLEMDIEFNKSAYGTNEPILVTADIKNGSVPITGATVTADVTSPTNLSNIPAGGFLAGEPDEGIQLFYNEVTQTYGEYIDKSSQVYYTYSKSTISLLDDGLHGDGLANDGIYGNYYTSTTAPGSYSFDISATGTNPVSGNFSRVASKSTIVTSSQGIMVTEPQTGVEWYSQCNNTINWSSTNIGGNVNIYLSTDGGSNYSIPLALNTPDDGYEQVIAPLLQSANCRIKVQSINSPTIYGINPGNFSIINVGGAGTITGTAVACQGQNSVAYHVDAIPNANGYTWLYTGTGALINGSTNNVTIDFAQNATSGILTVRATNACGNGTFSPDYPVLVNLLTNPTFGGEIGNAQSNGLGFDPNPITSISLPTGYVCGMLEFKWQFSVDNSSFFDIDNSNSETYDPGYIDQTTWFKRLARVTNMPDWTGSAQSNIIQMTIGTSSILDPWHECIIGNSNGYASSSGSGIFELSSTGYSSPSSDVQEFVYQHLSGNGYIIARVTDIDGGGWAGVQIRESCAPGSKKVLLKTQFQPLIRSEIRNTNNGAHFSSQILRQGIRWLKIARVGNRFDAYTSMDGMSWRSAFSATVTMGSNVQIGILSEGKNFTSTNVAKFDNVVITPTSKSSEAEASNYNSGKQVEIYPNPASKNVIIKIPDNSLNVKVSVYSPEGKMLHVQKIIQTETQLDINNLKSGVYILRFDFDGELITKRLVVL